MKRLRERLLRWLCTKGWHVGHVRTVLYGGDGPDEAAEQLDCPRCQSYGWRYCDGSTYWTKMTRY